MLKPSALIQKVMFCVMGQETMYFSKINFERMCSKLQIQRSNPIPHRPLFFLPHLRN
jgi:hypothetical protein